MDPGPRRHLHRNAQCRITLGHVDHMGVARSHARIGVAQKLLHCPQVAGVQVTQGGGRVAQGVVGEPGRFRPVGPQVLVGVHADPAAAQPGLPAVRARAIKTGVPTGRARLRHAEDKYSFQPRGGVRAQVRDPVAGLAMHQ